MVRIHIDTRPDPFHLVAGLLSLLVLLGTTTQTNSQDPEQQNEVEKLKSELQAMTALAERQKKLADIRKYAILLERAKEFWEDGNLLGARQLMDRTDEKLRGFEFGHLSSVINGGHKKLDAGRNIGGESIAVSRDGTWIATGGVPFDKNVRIWDGSTLELLETLSGHEGFVEDVDISNDGTFFASCGIRGKVIIWDVKTWKPKRTINADENEISSIAISPDDKRLVSASKSGRVKVWDIASGEPLIEFDKHSDNLHACSFSPDGKQIATGGREIFIWDSETGSIQQQIKPKQLGIYLKSLAFSPDGRRLATGHWDSRHMAQIWDVETGTQICHCPSAKARVNGVKFSPDGTTVAIACEDYLVHLCDAQSGELVKSFKGHDHYVYDVAFSPDGKRILSAGRFGSRVFAVDENDWPLTIRLTKLDSVSPNNQWLLKSNRNELQLIHLPTQRERLSLNGDGVTRVAFSADSSKFAIASKDKRIQIWDIDLAEPIQTLDSPFHPADSLLFNPNGSQLVSLANQNMLVAWDLQSGKKNFFRRTESKTLSENSFGFSPDGSLTYFVDGSHIEVLESATGKRVSLLAQPQQTSSLPRLNFCPDNTLILGGYSFPWGPGECLIVWNVTSGKREFIVNGSTGSFGGNAKWNPDGRTMMVKIRDDAFGDVMQVWDVKSKKRTVTLVPSHSIAESAFSPDGKRVATVGRNSIRFFDVETGELVYSLRHPDVRKIEFTPDGQYVRTTSGPRRSQTIKLWRRQ